MGAGVVTIGRNQYAVGLYWENSPSGRVAQTAREAARQPGQQADFYAVRPGNKAGRVPQFGLGQASAGHSSGMPAFAACIAGQQPGSWAGAFRLPEGVVVVIVRDDLVVPDGDQFFTQEAEARDRLLQEIGFGGLQRIYAPEAWSIPGADTMPISLLLDDRKDVRLQSVEVSRKTIMVIVAGVAILVIIIAAVWYIQEQQAEEASARAAQEEALQRAQNAARKLIPQEFQAAPKPVYPPPERKWENIPLPMDVIEACRGGLSQVPTAYAGWKLSQLKCTGGVLSLGWTRQKGFSAPPLKSVVSDDGGTAKYSITLPSLTPRGHEDLINPVDLTRRYLAQNWPGSIQRTTEDPPPAPPLDYKGEWNPPKPPWVKRSFTLTAPELPGGLAVFLGDLPGVVVESMTCSGGGGSSGDVWTIEGVIYENRT